jgi:hypothetical protein
MREVGEVLEEARRYVGAMERVDRGRVKKMVVWQNPTLNRKRRRLGSPSDHDFFRDRERQQLATEGVEDSVGNSQVWLESLPGPAGDLELCPHAWREA